MANVNKLNINNTEYGLEDARISTGTSAPSGGSNGDIYFQKTGGVQTSNGWSYIISPGGLCRMWKPVTIGSKTADHWWGNVGCVDAIMATQTYPVTFKSKPVVFYNNPTCDSANGFLFNCYSGQLATTSHPHQISWGRYNSLAGCTNLCAWLFVIGQV